MICYSVTEPRTIQQYSGPEGNALNALRGDTVAPIDLSLKRGRDMIRSALRTQLSSGARIERNVNAKPLARDAANTSDA